MGFILDMLDGTPWPFMEATPPGVPSGVIADIHVAGGFSGATLAYLGLSAGRFTASILLTPFHGGAPFEVRADTAAVRPHQAIPLLDAAGVAWGRLVTGPSVGREIPPAALDTGLDPLVILTTGQDDPLIPGWQDEAPEYTFQGGNGVVLALDPATNVVRLSVDAGVYAFPDSNAAGPGVREELDAGIAAIGQARGEAVNLVIEGMTPQLVASPGAPPARLLFVYTPANPDPWTGCGVDDPLADNIRCADDDGSGAPYPLDGFFCGQGGACKYKWEDA